MTGILNLQKNDILDLTKKDPTLKNITLGSGWDVAKKKFFSMQNDYDLDLVAILLNENEKLIKSSPVIYFGNKKAPGIFLHGDNTTGVGEGDDEKISISLDKLPKECNKVIFALNIYEAESRKQNFSKVNNAYVRLLNEDKGNTEICRYNLSDNGGDNTAIIFAELTRVSGDWQFKAVGELLKGTIKSLADRYK